MSSAEPCWLPGCFFPNIWKAFRKKISLAIPKLAWIPSAASSPAQAEGDHPPGEEGTVEHGHLLGVVVVVVVDVDGCRDPADDEGDPTGNQVEPARGGRRCHRTPGASPWESTARLRAGWACTAEQALPRPLDVGQGKLSPLSAPPWGQGEGQGCPYRSMGLGAGWDVSPSGCRGALQVTSL